MAVGLGVEVEGYGGDVDDGVRGDEVGLGGGFDFDVVVRVALFRTAICISLVELEIKVFVRVGVCLTDG